MMALVVEIYHAELLPTGVALPATVHTQAFTAACAGFLPAFACLQRLNCASWSAALRLTAPWLFLILPATGAALFHLKWFWGLSIAIPLGIFAYAYPKVEHPFPIPKRIFGFDKVRYRGLAKNHHRLCVCFALVNRYLHRKRLAALAPTCA